MFRWLENLSYEERRKQFGIIIDDFKSGGQIFNQKIAKTYNLEDWELALNEFEDYASEGKVLLKCNEIPSEFSNKAVII
jgi:hypothetical protein